MKKFLTSIVSAITLTVFCLNDLQLFPVNYNANAESYRTSYTIFGDLNNDKSIDSFDVILMRSKVMETEYDKLYDFNCDDKVDSDDLTLLSDYVLGKNCIFDAYLCDDADEDYVCDLIEVAYLKSNPDSKDSDGDTLTDFEEVVYTNTSPIDKYTRKLSVTDADDDADEDKLTNKEELALQTSPLLTDSDEDGIDDYEEINKYNTNPNDDDSDDDHIIDGDEIKLGLKPDSDKSNGSTYDYERIFDNKIPASSELLSYINAEGSPYEVSIDIKSAGNVNKALTVHTGDYSNTSEDNHIIGKSVLFSYDEKLSVDSAKIYFKPNDIDGSIENYMLFQFFPETNYLLPVETKYTKDSAYVETNELGTFCLVDVKDILDSKENTSKATSNGVQILAADIKVSPDDIVWDYTLDETEVLFYIDISNCATDTVESTKQSILDFSEALFEHCDNAAIQIIGYDFLSNVSGAKIQEYSDSNGSEILINLTSVVEAIEKIEADKQVAENDLDMAIYYLNNNIIRNGLFSSECKNRYVFITSDSSLSLTQNHTGYYYNGVPDDTKGILEEMSNEGIHVNTLFSDNLLNNSRAVKGIKYYKDACDEYDFGVYTKSSTGYFGNTGYARVYSDAISNIQSLSVMYTCSVSPNAIPSSVERNAFINSLPPSYDTSKVPAADSDGNVNFKDATVKVGAASLDKNGNLVFKNLYNACDESDLTRKGYEQLTENMGTSKKLVWDSFQITPFSDKILYDDKDGDMIPDIYDPFQNIVIYETEASDDNLLSGKECPEDYRYSDKSYSELCDMKWINSDDFTTNSSYYKFNIKTISRCFATGDMNNVIAEMFDNFFSGNGGKYSNDILTKEVKEHDSTIKYVKQTTDIVNQWIKESQGNITALKYDEQLRKLDQSIMVNNMKDTVYPPKYGDKLTGLGICIDAIYGNQIEITDYNYNGTDYEYTLKYTIYDIFGLDENDISHPDRLMDFGIIAMFRYWYIMQHYDKYNGNYKPFITYVIFEEKVKGTI